MRILRFRYTMTLDFSMPAAGHQFTLRMLPRSDPRQQVITCEVKLEPECVLNRGEDAFGNPYVYGEIKKQHTRFSVEVSGRAVVENRGIPIEKKNESDRYRYASRYTKAGDRLKEYFITVQKECAEKGYTFVEKLMHQLYQDMEYRQGVTDISTTAEEAIGQRQGVCQDYAHIMIALCRLGGIAARYVVGMMSGEGYSHAWVEVCLDGIWYGVDPTNNRMVDDGYIKISHGRDYQDCIVNRGVFLGGGQQVQTVAVLVEEEMIQERGSKINDRNHMSGGTSGW